MAYSGKIEWIGAGGTPTGPPQFFEAKDEADAVLIAANEVDNSKPRRSCIATVTDADGRQLFTYSGRTVRARA